MGLDLARLLQLGRELWVTIAGYADVRRQEGHGDHRDWRKAFEQLISRHNWAWWSILLIVTAD
jgi:hypothetical protein